MAGNEIAQAWVTLIPSFQGGQKAIAKELGAAGTSGGKEASKGFVSGIGGGVLKAGKIAAGGVALVGGAIAGIAAAGGFNRAMQIEQAQAKLTGLGHDTKSVEAIMKNATAAVSGTAYGLGDAASVAAATVAAGVKPGKELERTLTLVGDAAAIAGTDMGTMGSIVNKVATSDMMQMDVANQLMDAGIPILQLVAEEMGVTAEEARKMASEGKVSFETFQNAIETGMGGAALESGKTFTGAMANVRAALGRVGATVLTPFLNALTEGSGTLIPIIDSVNAALGPVMENVGAWMSTTLPKMMSGMQGLYDLVANGNFSSSLREAFGWEEDSAIVGFLFGVRDALSQVAGLVTGAAAILFTGNFVGSGIMGVAEDSSLVDFLFNVRDGIAGLAGEASGGFGAMVAAFQDGEDHITSSGLAGFLEGIGVVARNVFDVLAPLFGQLGPILAPIIPQIAEFASAFSPVSMVFQALAPLLPQIAELVAQVATTFAQLLAAVIPLAAQLAGAIIPVLTQLAAAVLPVVGTILGVIAGLLPQLVPLFAMLATAVVGVVAAIAPLVVQLVSSVLPIFAQLVSAVLPLVVSALAAIIPAVMMVVQVLTAVLVPIIQALLPVVTMVFQTIATVVKAVMQVISGIIQVVMGAISGNWGAVWNGILSILQGVWNLIQGVVMGAITIVAGVIAAVLGTIVGLWNGAWTGISSFLSNTWASITGAVSAGIGSIKNWFSSLPGDILGFLSGLPGQMLSMGKNIIQGLINGIKSAGDAVKGVIGDLVGGAINFGKSLLGINSPSRVFMEIGEFTGEGLALGISSQSKAVQRATDKLMPSASAGQLGFDPAPLSAAGTAGASGGAGSLEAAFRNAMSTMRPVVQIGNREFHGVMQQVNSQYGGR
ncbi:tape measure protein [Citricoccus sp. K5]|uniref:phage tail protein n=1 Tax=Citricoccus sp. K5 TaxID=2653135 RepID=UPI0012EF48D8|nr:tape measure protein [Citricoccus sp. K5]VXB22459.1 membrane hypothetical protein [Citricoccus sp. K5]